MSLEKCPNELLLMIAAHLTPKDTSSFLQTNRRLANLLTPDFAKLLWARTFPNRGRRLRLHYTRKRRLASASYWPRRQRMGTTVWADGTRSSERKRAGGGKGDYSYVHLVDDEQREYVRYPSPFDSPPLVPAVPLAALHVEVGDFGKASSSSSSAAVNGTHGTAGGGHPNQQVYSTGVYVGANKPLPKVRCWTRYQALFLKLTKGWSSSSASSGI
ncbi:hypothetical protein L873DRAFT_1802520 [Choiromyces venosus 120613-1]|uniref:F-box domain-containing protein n=1 Tax=Choiromyces venosus 120613-1 TaxID=1336337 RepID=A0A3N4JV58_9PEZI|nr:hypothetical protein L873DRAFT_1802520 [Choiromyces venosus 120613-1]